MKRFVSVLGARYKIIRTTAERDLRLRGSGGIIDWSTKEILINVEEPSSEKMQNLRAVERNSLRHEIVHAFMYESGLAFDSLVYECGWAKNEEMIDWFARQGPKIYAAWQEAGAL